MTHTVHIKSGMSGVACRDYLLAREVPFWEPLLTRPPIRVRGGLYQWPGHITTNQTHLASARGVSIHAAAESR